MNDNLVSVKNVSVEFDYQENFLSKKQKIYAVKNDSLDIKKKSFLGKTELSLFKFCVSVTLIII